jgi:hypothetical protein
MQGMRTAVQSGGMVGNRTTVPIGGKKKHTEQTSMILSGQPPKTSHLSSTFPMEILGNPHSNVAQDNRSDEIPPASFDTIYGIEELKSEDKIGLGDYPTLDEHTISEEEALAKSTMRLAAPLKALPVEQVLGVDWSQNIFDRAHIVKLAEERLNPKGFKIKGEIIQMLSEAVQDQCRAVIDAAISRSRKRRNKSAAQSYSSIANNLRATNGMSSTGLEQNLGMQFGIPVKEIFYEEEYSARELLSSGLRKWDETILEELRATEDDGGKKSKSKDKAEANLSWWDKDFAEEDSGKLSWDGLAVLHRKHQVAMVNNIGPFFRKKSRIDAAEKTIPKPSSKVSSQIQNSIEKPWELQPFPLSTGHTSNDDLIIKDDVLSVLLKLARPTAGVQAISNSIGFSSHKAKIEMVPRKSSIEFSNNNG